MLYCFFFATLPLVNIFVRDGEKHLKFHMQDLNHVEENEIFAQTKLRLLSICVLCSFYSRPVKSISIIIKQMKKPKPCIT